MRILISFAVLSLVSLAVAAPSTSSATLVINKNFYDKQFIKYKSEHEIVKLLTPLNNLNEEFFNELESSSSESNSKESNEDIYVFFVEADFDADGKRVDKGVYVLYNEVATKLLDHGRDLAAGNQNSTEVFIATKGGIYVYSKEKISAEKYGTIDDSIIGITTSPSSHDIYILTEDRNLFKVTEKGTKKEKIESVVNANQIMLDLSENLFFYSDDKQPFVLTADGVKKIEGLPENPSSVTLVQPPAILETGVPVVVNNVVYFIYPNGTAENFDIEFNSKALPTAYAPETILVQYYAHDKKIYEYNILVMLLSQLLEEFQKYLQEKSNDIQAIASNKKRLNKRN